MQNFTSYILTGVTGAGKTKYAINLAKKLIKGHQNLLIISVDSRKAYKYLDVGTNKFAFLNNINLLSKLSNKHNTKVICCGINLFLPNETINVFEFYKRLTITCKNKITGLGNFKTIIFGGTLLYLRPLLNLPIFDNPPSLPYLRKLLEALPNEKIKKLAGLIIPDFNKLNYSEQNNIRRLIRKIEITLIQNEKVLNYSAQNLDYLNFKINIQKFMQEYMLYKQQYQINKKYMQEIRSFISSIIKSTPEVKLFVPNNILNHNYLSRLIARILNMFKLGFANETLDLIDRYKKEYYTYSQLSKLPAFKIMGYDILSNFFNNLITQETSNLVKKLNKKTNTPNYYNYDYLKKQASYLDSYLASLFDKKINEMSFSDYLANYYIKNNSFGIKKMANDLCKQFSLQQQSMFVLLSIFKKHLDYARYQKQSIKSILNLTPSFNKNTKDTIS